MRVHLALQYPRATAERQGRRRARFAACPRMPRWDNRGWRSWQRDTRAASACSAPRRSSSWSSASTSRRIRARWRGPATASPDSTTACRCTGCATGRCRFRSWSSRRTAPRCATSTATSTPTSASATPARCSATRRRRSRRRSRARPTRGLTYMLPTEDAIAVGRLLTERFGLPHWQVATTATDANRFALRVARAVTGRPKILVFNGCYHGTVDETFVRLVDGRAVNRPGPAGAGRRPDAARARRRVQRRRGDCARRWRMATSPASSPSRC